MKSAFTMIEVIFVIVVLGILASIALPKFSGVVGDAYISKAQSQVAAVRSGISNYRSEQLLKGANPLYPVSLDNSKLFDVVSSGVTSGTDVGEWSSDGNTYTFKTSNGDIVFNYDSATGSFECNRTASYSATICDRFTN